MIIFFASAVETYCDTEVGVKDYEKTKEFYFKYIKEGFKNCEIEVNLDNFIEVLTTIRDKYL